MAVRKIAFPVVYQQNTNVQSEAYGKLYPKPYKPDTLSLRGDYAKHAAVLHGIIAIRSPSASAAPKKLLLIFVAKIRNNEELFLSLPKI